MYKHFEISGTGIRSLLDIFLFRRAHEKQLDQSALQQGLEQLGLTDFDRETCALAKQVFDSDAPCVRQTPKSLPIISHRAPTVRSASVLGTNWSRWPVTRSPLRQ